MKNGEVVLMMQQLSFSPVENILTVLFWDIFCTSWCGAYGTGNGDIIR